MKPNIILFILSLIIFADKIYSQSDNCSSATTISVTANCTSPVSGTTIGATQNIAGCVGTADDDVWYKFTATATSHIITVVPSATMDPVVQLFSGTCSSLISLNCMDNGLTGETETINASGLSIGTVYTIRVYHYYAGSGSGTFTICVTPAPSPPANDNCTSSTLLTVNVACSYTNGTSVSATQSIIGCAGTADDDVWYKFVATNSVQTITVDPSAAMDPVIELFSGACATQTSVTCMDNGFTDGNEVISAVGLVAGNTYFVRVYDYYSGSGGFPFQICITGAATAAPTNDEPCNAIQLPAVNSACNYLSFTTVGATTSTTSPTPASCAGGSAPQQGGFNNSPQPKDVWFKFTVPSSGKVAITAQPGYGISDGVMALYSGTCGALTQIACADDYNYPGASNDFKPFILATGLNPGTTVFLRYWAFNGNTTGVFGLCVSTPTNDGCGGNLYICDLNNYAGTTSAAYTVDRPCNMRANAEMDNPPTYTYTPGTCQGGIFGLGGSWGTGAPNCDVQINNNSWIKFTASNTTATLVVNIGSCFIGSYPSGGIQMQIFSASSSCCGFTPVSDFKEGSSQLSITANNLTIGNDYYLMIDGFAGDICNYSISASAGVQFPDITTSSTSICSGQTITLYGPVGASAYEWSPGGQTTQNITVTPAYSQTYSLEATGVCGYRQTRTIFIAVNNLPAATANSNTPVCETQTINLAAGGGASYSWSGPGGWTSSSSTPTRTNATAAMAGTYTVTVTSSAGCTSVTTTSVTINSNPTATAGNSGPFCVGSTISLTSSGGALYNWSGPVGFTSSSQNPTRTNATTGMAGTYYVTVTGSNGCMATGSTVVTINAAPSVTTGNSGPFCEGSIISLSSSGGTSYSWSGPGGWTSSSQNPTRTNATIAMAGTYSVTVTNSNSCTSIGTTTVTINSNPSATASNTGPYCASQTISMTAGGGTSYSWSGPGGWTSTSSTPTRSNATTAMTGTYTVTVTGSNTCTSITTTNVTVNSNPVANAGTDQNINNGTNTTLNGSASGGSGSYSYSWAPSNLLVNATIQNPQTVNLSSTTVFTVTVTDNTTGCSGTDQITVYIIGGTLAVTGTAVDYTVCIGTQVQLNAFGSGGNPGNYQYTWSSSPSGFSSTQTNPNVTPIVNTIYTVSLYDGFNTITDTVNVLVYSLPVANAGLDVSICNGNTTSLNASASTGFPSLNYAWSNSDNGISQIVSPASTTTYTLTVTDGHGCTNTDAIIVNIYQLPNANAGNDQVVCAGTNVTLTASGGSTYQWSNGITQGVPFTASVTTIYTVTVTNSYNCTATDNVTVTVNPLPTPVISGSISVCQGSTNTYFTNNITGNTYSWTITGGTPTSATSNSVDITWSNTGTGAINLTETITATTCSATASTLNVTVHATPIANAGQNDSICIGNSTTITASGGTNYIWSNGAVSASQSVSPVITTNYIVTVTDNYGCTSTDMVTVKVNPNPVTEAGGNQNIFNGTSANLSGSATGGTGPYSYLWSPSNMLNNANLQYPQTVNLNTSTIFYLTVTDLSSGCTSADQVTIFIIGGQLSIVGTATDYSICSGDQLLLHAIPSGGNPANYQYTWTSNNSGFTSGLTDTTDYPSINTIYTISLFDGTNLVTDTVTVTVNTMPTADAGANQTVCAGTNVTLTANGGGTYAWDYGVLQGISFLPINTNTYSVTVTNASGCSATDTVTITVNPLPIANAGNDQTVCTGTSVTLSGSGGSSYQWSNGVVQDTPFTINTTTTYNVTVTNSSNCSSSDNVTITVNPLPTPQILGTSNLCQGTTALYSSNSTNNTYLWNITGGSPATSSSGNVNITWITSGLISLTETIASTSCESTSTLNVTVNSLPVANAGQDTSICKGGSANLHVSGTGLTYNWNNGLGTNSLQTVSPITTTIYVVTVTDGSSCSNADSIKVTVLNLPNAIAGIDDEVCKGTSITLDASLSSGSGTLYYLWNNNLGSGATHSIVADSAKIYIVTVTDPSNCSDADSIIITTINVPDYSLDLRNTTCFGNNDGKASVVLNSAVQPIVYAWSTGSSVASIAELLAGNYSITVTDSTACQTVKSFEIKDAGDITCLEIPSAFTPNADGVNDSWEIKHIDLYPKATVEIYNRWGVVIFSSDNYANPQKCWDGKYKGNDVPAGSFIYIINLQNDTDLIQGVVTIIR